MAFSRSAVQLVYLGRCALSTQSKPNLRYDTAEKMSAWQIHQYGGNEKLQLSHTVKTPILHNPDDMLIKVHAASVNPLDCDMRGGYGQVMFDIYRRRFGKALKSERVPEFPMVLGRDFSGVIVSAGRNVHKYEPGDEVWGALGPTRRGTHAQYTIASAKEISRKPKCLTHVEAGSMPYTAMTAWSALCTIGEVTKDNAQYQRVLIFAGSGGVGSFAIQLMKAWGAEVTTTCSTDAVPLCQSLGADQVIDYKTQHVRQELNNLAGFDVILDTLGGDTPNFAIDLLKTWRLSKYITIKTPLLKNADDSGVFGMAKSVGSLGCSLIQGFQRGRSYRWAFFFPNGRALATVADLVNKDQIHPVVEQVFPFDQVPQAFEKVEGKHARGKTVIDFQNMD